MRGLQRNGLKKGGLGEGSAEEWPEKGGLGEGSAGLSQESLLIRGAPSSIKVSVHWP